MGMYSEEKISIGFSVFIAIAGLLVDLAWKCTNGFSRSGSLIVCVGIISGSLILKKVIKKKHEARENYLESIRQEMDIVFSDKELKEKVRGTADSQLKEAERILEKDTRRILVVETCIVVFGTLIWGFGDLLLRSPCKMALLTHLYLGINK